MALQMRSACIASTSYFGAPYYDANRKWRSFVCRLGSKGSTITTNTNASCEFAVIPGMAVGTTESILCRPSYLVYTPTLLLVVVAIVETPPIICWNDRATVFASLADYPLRHPVNTLGPAMASPTYRLCMEQH